MHREYRGMVLVWVYGGEFCRRGGGGTELILIKMPESDLACYQRGGGDGRGNLDVDTLMRIIYHCFVFYDRVRAFFSRN